MTPSVLALLVLGFGFIAWSTARARSMSMVRGPGRSLARPSDHGWYAALWAAVPALMFAAFWAWLTPQLITAEVMSHPTALELPAEPVDRTAVLSEARSLAEGTIDAAFSPLAAALAEPWRSAAQNYRIMGLAVGIVIAFVGIAFAFSRLRPGFRAGPRVERFAMIILAAASLIAILTTVGIVASLLAQSIRFFTIVSPLEFLFGATWNPQTGAGGQYGALPLFWGTMFIGAIIAMAVAIPLGLMSAIFLTQYAPPRVRTWVKPLLEILAGIPTVVYGYFAALTVAPAIRDAAQSLGISSASSESALAAGVVMGVMIIPFVSSMADDSITAVPRAMRDGSLALGATTSETIRQVILPAALPGVVGGVLLAVSRAIGETMIVVMAAGLAANLTVNPLASVTTVTAQIVQLLTGDQEFDSAKTLAAFALGLVLFVVTFALNVAALRVVRAYREAYE